MITRAMRMKGRSTWIGSLVTLVLLSFFPFGSQQGKLFSVFQQGNFSSTLWTMLQDLPVLGLLGEARECWNAVADAVYEMFRAIGGQERRGGTLWHSTRAVFVAKRSRPTSPLHVRLLEVGTTRTIGPS